MFTLSGTLLGLVGTGIISLGMPGETHLGPGALLVLLAAACSGTTFVLQRPLACRYGAAKAAGWPLIVGALLLAPWLPTGLRQAAAAPQAIAAIAFLALGAGVLGYACWMVALAGLGASRAANFLFLMAPLATVLAIPINGHVPPPTTILGGAATLAGVWIVHRAYRRAPATDLESR
ncbi:DMT family transporter [Allosphingosinicella deserti]|nr:DMT family transporter [Sphingomonas deserti]